MRVKERKERSNLLRLLSWRMMAESVLFITHSSSLPMPSGNTPRHRCLGSMFLFTSGMTDPYTAAVRSTCKDKTQTLYLKSHTCAQTTTEAWRQGPSIMFTQFSTVFGWSSYYITDTHTLRESERSNEIGTVGDQEKESELLRFWLTLLHWSKPTLTCDSEITILTFSTNEVQSIPTQTQTQTITPSTHGLVRQDYKALRREDTVKVILFSESSELPSCRSKDKSCKLIICFHISIDQRIMRRKKHITVSTKK